MPFPALLRHPRLQHIAATLSELCFPAVCAHCDQPGHGYPLCHACLGTVERLAAEPACDLCGALLALEDAGCQRCRGKGLPHVEHVARFCVYDGPARSLLLAAKFNRSWPLAEYLATLARERHAIRDALAANDVLVPIPLHPRRLWSRGFNQSDVIARTLTATRQGAPPVAAEGHKPIVAALSRVKSTALQARQASATARTRNVAGAFAVRRPSRVIGKRVLLIDDILTTGATLTEAARTLKKAGAKQVSAIVLAVADPRAGFDT